MNWIRSASNELTNQLNSVYYGNEHASQSVSDVAVTSSSGSYYILFSILPVFLHADGKFSYTYTTGLLLP
jgi:hypothetical protein